VLPDAAPGSPEYSGSASFAHHSDFSREGVKPVTMQACLPAGREGTAQFLPSRYKILLALRVSRYKFDASDILVAGNKFYALQWSGPGLSPVIKLSWVQEQIAKTVTNNLPLSVIGLRSILKLSDRICQLDDFILQKLAR
jgi:hypothetical protein